jgi:hypothetical protein
MAETKTKDAPLDQVKAAPDLDALAMALDSGRLEDASATALWLIACELRLIRQNLASVIGGHAFWVRNGDAV